MGEVLFKRYKNNAASEVQYTYRGKISQQWKIVEDGGYNFINVNANQQWKLIPIGIDIPLDLTPRKTTATKSFSTPHLHLLLRNRVLPQS